MGNRKRVNAYILVEVLVAVIVLSIILSSTFGVLLMARSLSSQTNAKIEAINFARSAADKLLDCSTACWSTLRGRQRISAASPYFTSGNHTDPLICELPSGYFKDTLNGRMSYNVDVITVDSIDMLRIEVVVTWDDLLDRTKSISENLFFAIFTNIL